MKPLPYDTEYLAALLQPRPGEVVLGKLVKLEEAGQPWVNFSCNPQTQPLPALTTVPLSRNSVGRQVALLFAEGDLRQPIIMGLIHAPSEVSAAMVVPSAEGENLPLEARLDGKQVVLEAQRKIVLQCGKASITLTQAGKIILRGTYIFSRSSGVNKIKGGSVQIN